MDRHPLVDRVEYGGEVVDQEGGAIGVVDLTVLGDLVVVGHPVLGDVEIDLGRPGVLGVQPDEQPPQAAGLDRPAHRSGPRSLRVADHTVGRRKRGAERSPGRRLGIHRLVDGSVAEPLTEVVVDPQHVDRRGDGRQIAGPDDLLQAETGHVGEHVLGVRRAEDRVQEDPVHLPVHPAGRVDVTGTVGVHRIGNGEVEGQAEPQARVRGA